MTPPAPGNDWASLSVASALRELDCSPLGLTTSRADAVQATMGRNVIRPHRANAAAVLLRQFRNAVLLLLLGTAALAGVLGDVTDGVIIGVILIASVGLGFVNEYAAERATARLMDSLTQSAVVERDGRTASIPVGDLVPGDIVRLSMGCKVPADLRIIASSELSCDESVLSGESLPSSKSAEPVAAAASIADRTSMAFMGTVVRGGTGTGVVVATGARTEIGRLAAGLDRRAPETAFQAGLRRFSLLLVWVAAALVATVLVTGVLLGRPLIQSVLFALAIAVGVTPQLLPAVVNSSLAAGARRLAKRQVLVKRLVCIEDIGNISVLVTDKTGTLTEGVMTFEGGMDATGAPAPGLAMLASATVDGGGAGTGTTDALDGVLLAAAGPGGPPAIATIPFDHDRRISSALVDVDGARLLVAKGAPESILARCVALSRGGGARRPRTEQGRPGDRRRDPRHARRDHHRAGATSPSWRCAAC